VAPLLQAAQGDLIVQQVDAVVNAARVADTAVTVIRFIAFDGATLARYLELLD
jgi:hypothetical protein